MPTDPAQVKRTREIEEASNLYLIHPISRALVSLFVRLGVHPNAVSVGGLLCGGLAAWAYFHYMQWEMVVLGFAFMIGWHIMDGADGQLARLTGKTSELGKALDGLVDHVSFALVYIALTVAAARVFGHGVWAVAIAAGLSHLVQASSYEFQRQLYDYWGFRKESAKPLMPADYRASIQGRTGIPGILAQIQLAYYNLQHRLAGVDLGLLDQLEAMKADGRAEDISEAYRAINRRAVKSWSVMSSNYRTLAIFAACLAKNPVYFFLFEIVVLNLALIGLRLMQARCNADLMTSLHARADAAPLDPVAAT